MVISLIVDEPKVCYPNCRSHGRTQAFLVLSRQSSTSEDEVQKLEKRMNDLGDSAAKRKNKGTMTTNLMITKAKRWHRIDYLHDIIQEMDTNPRSIIATFPYIRTKAQDDG